MAASILLEVTLFLPYDLGRRQLEPFFGVCPCCVCIRKGATGSPELSQVMSGVRQDDSMVWRSCQKAPCSQAGLPAISSEALGTGRPETPLAFCMCS